MDSSNGVGCGRGRAESGSWMVEAQDLLYIRPDLMGFYQRFVQSAERWPENIAVELQRSNPELPVESYSYAELRRMAESAGHWLQSRAVQRGARCALLGANGPRWVAAYLGALAAGAVAVPLDTAFHADQVAKLLRNCEASLLFADARQLQHAREAVRGLNTEIVLLERVPEAPEACIEDAFADGPGEFRPVEGADDDIAVVLYTSGTTSDPKGVTLTHGNLAAEADGAFAVVRLGPTDSILGVLPLFHALAQMANLLLPFVVGARVVYLEALNTADILRALRERKVTLFCCVPQFFYLIHERITKELEKRGALAAKLSRGLLAVCGGLRKLGLNPGKVLFRKAHDAVGTSMRYLVTGGSRFDPQIGRDLYAMGFDILQGYGLTETSGGCALTPPERNVIGSVGRTLPGNELKIVNAGSAEGSGPATGEVAVHGPLVMKGYWNRPDATAEVIRDGWLHTGDLGYLDAQGNLFITGRQKEIIVLSNGKNVYPEEVEAYYLRSPFIKEICVLGLESKPGEPFSERLHGVIVPNFELLKERKIVNAREVIRFDIDSISATLPSTKRILSYEFWQEELPRTTTRKLKRFQIKQRVGQGGGEGADAGQARTRELTEEDQLWMAQPEVARAMEVVRDAARKKTERVLPGDNLELDLGLDSMERVELLVALERELGAHVEDSVIAEVYTVKELVEAVRARMGVASRRAEAEGWEAILATETTDPEVTRIAKPHPVIARLWYGLSRVLRIAFLDLFGLEVSGLEKLPKAGPCIISPNHQSYLDAVVLATVLPLPLFENVFSVGTSEIFGQGPMRHAARALNIVPVDPDANLVPAMRAGAFGLKRGKVLVLFPEGERSIDGAPKKFKKGAAILAAHMKVPIYPVAIDGLQTVMPRGKGFQKFAKVKITFGDPVLPPEKVENPEQIYAQLTDTLKARVVELWEGLHNGRTRAAAAD